MADKKERKEKKEKKEKKSKKERKEKEERKEKRKAEKSPEREQKKAKVEQSIMDKSSDDDEKTVVVADQHIDEYRISSQKIDKDIPENLRLTSFPFTESTLANLKARNVTQLFPIQAAAFEPVINGSDLLARARTGTGKTLAFSLPVVETLKKILYENPKSSGKRGRAPSALIMAPTRELAIQVHKELDQLCNGELATTCVYGGTMMDTQYYAFRDGVDIVVGTPGRLIDHIERGNLKLQDLRFLVMDEADQMLDIGFGEDMEKILKFVQEQKGQQSDAIDHQTLLFSATMPDWIKQAVKKYMKDSKITLDLIGTNKQKTSATVKHYCLPSRWENRSDVLGDVAAVYGRGHNGKTIIFVETKREASELAMNEKLVAMGAQALHGDIAQKQRETTMQGYREGKFNCLITTNVCARGVDIPEVDLVINCEPPQDVESYIHRSGRTGRAGKSGSCITFYKQNQEYLVENISRKAGVDFVKIGAPQPKDIVAARAEQNLEELKKVEPGVLEYFQASASELLEYFDNDALKALQCAMAMICGTTKKLPQRSLLSANTGFVTLHFIIEQSIRNIGYIKSMLQKSYPELKYEDTLAWRMTADSKGVVVDVTETKVEIGDGFIKLGGKLWQDGRGVKLVIPEELPELQTKSNFGGNSAPSRGGRSFGGRGGSRGGYSRGSNHGGYSSRGRRSY